MSEKNSESAPFWGFEGYSTSIPHSALCNLNLVNILSEILLVKCMGFAPQSIWVMVWVMGDEGFMGLLRAYPAYQVGN